MKKKLPTVSEDFIKIFVKAKGLSKVMVDMEPDSVTPWDVPIILDDNEIIVSLSKESYTREEVVNLCRLAWNAGDKCGTAIGEPFNQWIREKV